MLRFATFSMNCSAYTYFYQTNPIHFQSTFYTVEQRKNDKHVLNLLQRKTLSIHILFCK